jgi:hypothetical protein
LRRKFFDGEIDTRFVFFYIKQSKPEYKTKKEKNKDQPISITHRRKKLPLAHMGAGIVLDNALIKKNTKFSSHLDFLTYEENWIFFYQCGGLSDRAKE